MKVCRLIAGLIKICISKQTNKRILHKKQGIFITCWKRREEVWIYLIKTWTPPVSLPQSGYSLPVNDNLISTLRHNHCLCFSVLWRPLLLCRSQQRQWWHTSPQSDTAPHWSLPYSEPDSAPQRPQPAAPQPAAAAQLPARYVCYKQASWCSVFLHTYV